MEKAVKLETCSGDLFGTLRTPSDDKPSTLIIIHPGSGPTDRDGNQPGLTNNSLNLLANGLSECGVASLRIDKRGVGESQSAVADESNLTIESYVTDLVSWTEFAKNTLETSNLYLLGHSEGGLIATLAAQRISLSGLILIAAAGQRAGALILAQLEQAAIGPELMEKAEECLAKLELDQPISDPPESLQALFRSSVQPYLASWLKYDPAQELAKLSAPTLIVDGENDVQIDLSNADRLLAAMPSATRITIAEMNHVLKSAPVERQRNLDTYALPELPVAPELVDQIVPFVS